MNAEKGMTRYRFMGTEYVGTYEIDGFIMTVTSDLGVLKASVGLMKPHRLAQNLLKALCRKSIGVIVAVDKASVDVERPQHGTLESVF